MNMLLILSFSLHISYSQMREIGITHFNTIFMVRRIWQNNINLCSLNYLQHEKLAVQKEFTWSIYHTLLSKRKSGVKKILCQNSYEL